jgi:hypothetical protein
VSGGTQQSLGAFVQDIFTPFDNLVLTLSARLDKWSNYDGHFLETTVATGLPTANNRPTIPDSNDTSSARTSRRCITRRIASASGAPPTRASARRR